MKSVFLATSRIDLIPLTMEDASWYFDSYTPDIALYMYHKAPSSLSFVQRRLKELIERTEDKQDFIGKLILKTTGEAIGIGGLRDINLDHPSVYVWIVSKSQRKGLGLEFIQGLCEWSRGHLRVKSIGYPIDEGNMASIALARKFRAEVIGTYETIAEDGSKMTICDYRINQCYT